MSAIPPVSESGNTLSYQSSIHRSEGTVWQEAGKVVALNNAIFPQRCVKCNADQDVAMKKRTFTWYPPLLALLAVVSLLIFVIVVFIVQKRSTITYGLCKAHRRQHLLRVLTAWGIFVLSLILFGAAIGEENGWLALAGVVVLLGSLVYTIIAVPVLRATNIDSNKVIRLTRTGREFVVSLPGRVN